MRCRGQCARRPGDRLARALDPRTSPPRAVYLPASEEPITRLHSPLSGPRVSTTHRTAQAMRVCSSAARSVTLRDGTGTGVSPALRPSPGQRDAEARPARVDLRADLRRHARDLRPPPLVALRGPLGASRRSRSCRRGLQVRSVVELVERAAREHDVAAGVDVRADAARRPRRSRARPRPASTTTITNFVSDEQPVPQIACITLRACPGNALRIETMQQLWNAPADRQVVVHDLGARRCAARAGRCARSPCPARRPPRGGGPTTIDG